MNYSKCCYCRTKHDHRVMLLSDKTCLLSDVIIETCGQVPLLPGKESCLSSVVVGTRSMVKCCYCGAMAMFCCGNKNHGQVLLLSGLEPWPSVVIVRTKTMAKCCYCRGIWILILSHNI